MSSDSSSYNDPGFDSGDHCNGQNVKGKGNFCLPLASTGLQVKAPSNLRAARNQRNVMMTKCLDLFSVLRTESCRNRVRRRSGYNKGWGWVWERLITRLQAFGVDGRVVNEMGWLGR